MKTDNSNQLQEKEAGVTYARIYRHRRFSQVFGLATLSGGLYALNKIWEGSPDLLLQLGLSVPAGGVTALGTIVTAIALEKPGFYDPLPINKPEIQLEDPGQQR